MSRFFLPLVFLLAYPVVGSAQDAPVFEVRGGFGASRYLHGDLGYTAPTWLVALRLGMGSFAIEPEFASARHEKREVFGPAPGTSTQTVVTTTDTYQSVAVNLLGRWGRTASVYAGGGPGFYWEDDRYKVDAPVNGYEQNTTRGPRLGAQIVAGVDVPIVSRVKAFGQFRYEIRSFEDPGGGSVVQGFAGVAIALK